MNRKVSGIILALLLSCLLTLMLNPRSAEAWNWRINLERKEDFLVYTSTKDHPIGLIGSEIGYDLIAGDKIGVAWWATESPTLLPPIVYLLNQDQYDHWFRPAGGPTHGYLFKKVDWGETSFTYDISSNGKYYVVIDNPNWGYIDPLGFTIHFIYYEAVYWPQHYYLTVYSPYGTLSGEGLYDRGETAYASLDTGIVDHGNRTRRCFTNWGVDASGTNYAQSNPIIMDTNKTAMANWKTQYYLTVASAYGTTGGEAWYDDSSTAYATLDTGVVNYGNGTRRVFTNWSGDASGTNSAQSNLINMDGPKTAVANWKTQYLLTVYTDPTGLTPQPIRNPAGEAELTNSWWHDESANVILTAQPVTGYAFNYWDVDGVSQGNKVNPITVSMITSHTTIAYYVQKQPLSVSISPLSADIFVGESVTFTSVVSGGTSPYSYQWYLNGNPVLAATTDGWTFMSTTTGIYYIYLKVTDVDNNIAQSQTAKVTVRAVPVGGYSFSVEAQTTDKLLILHIVFIAILTIGFSPIKSKTTRKAK